MQRLPAGIQSKTAKPQSPWDEDSWKHFQTRVLWSSVHGYLFRTPLFPSTAQRYSRPRNVIYVKPVE